MSQLLRVPSAPIAAPATWPWRVAARTALTDLAPTLLTLAPIGLVVGLAIGRSRIGLGPGLLSGLGIFAGAAPLSALDLLVAGAAVGTVVASVALINARLLLYGATLEPHFRGQPAWFRWLAPQFIVEFTFALTTARDDLADPTTFRRYWLSLGAQLAVAWSALLTLGATVGPALTGLAAVLAAAPVVLFVGILVPRLTTRPAVAGALTSFVVTGVLALTAPLPAGAPVLLGTAAGVAAAAWLRGRS
jgi:predicted branched-subunit amino acid permease